jgi:hypothetical protein
MKIKIDCSMRGLKTHLLALAFAAVAVPLASASTDYAPAVWKPNCGQFYTSGNIHDFQVLHSLEGYYLASISFYQKCSTAASLHYLVNAKQDTSSDAAPGETTQMVREAYWAWHANCWATYMFGTGHEGFNSSPAWQTTKLYTESAVLTRHLSDTASFPKDRNHIIGDKEGSNAAWVTWLGNNYPGINASCNSSAIGMGIYFDWKAYMDYVKGTIVDNTDAGFSASANWLTGTSPTAHGGNYRFHPTQPISDVATWTTTTAAGKYQLSAYWPQGTFSATAPYLISTTTGTQTIIFNQGVNGGQWNLMGTYTLASGTNTIKLSCWTSTGAIVAADAVKWLKVSDF